MLMGNLAILSTVSSPEIVNIFWPKNLKHHLKEGVGYLYATDVWSSA